MRTQSWSDERVDQIIGRILQVGVTAAAVVVLAGGLLYLVDFTKAPVQYRAFHPEKFDIRAIWHGMTRGIHVDSRAAIQVGILMLIATPVIRVAFSTVAFWLERDRMYVAFTLVVLAILLFSLFFAG